MAPSIDYETELADVSAAISKVLKGGQDVWYEQRRVTRADLAELRAHRDDLVSKINRQSRGGVRQRRVVPLS
jgi:hypothetical protein